MTSSLDVKYRVFPEGVSYKTYNHLTVTTENNNLRFEGRFLVPNIDPMSHEKKSQPMIEDVTQVTSSLAETILS